MLFCFLKFSVVTSAQMLSCSEQPMIPFWNVGWMQLLVVTQRCCALGGLGVEIIIANNLSLKMMSLSCQMPRFSHLLAYLLQATIKGRFINTSASESCLGVKTTAFLASDSHHMARKKQGYSLFSFISTVLFVLGGPTDTFVTKVQLSLGQNLAITWQHAALWKCKYQNNNNNDDDDE